MANFFNDRLLIHVEKIDNQHRNLFEILDELQQACKKEKGKKVIRELFNSLKKYAVIHFLDEEKVMIKNNYPGYLEHRKMHKAFSKKVLELEKTLNNKEIPLTTLVEVNSFLSKWLITHIGMEDKKIGQFLSQKQ